MILLRPDPSAVTLQVLAVGLDGAPKLDVTAADVRVYAVTGAGEVEALPVTSLVQVAGTGTWRLRWTPTALAVGQYVAEYRMTDILGQTCVVQEDVVVHDLALQADLDLVRKVETGRWKIAENKMTFYGDDGITPLLVFNLKNEAGIPAMDEVFERVPA
jgi:hypothetical protein